MDQFDEDLDPRTSYIEVDPKTIITRVDSPDVPFGYSINPYQGCEHGCVYCYARNSHNYWGYSAGLEFETKILVKKKAPELLAKKLASKSWQAAPIMLSGNRDAYQPAERKFKITRQLLVVFRRFGHPVGITTKGSLILRDIDVLKDLARHDLISIAVSINTLDDEIRAFLEPRAASIPKRLEVVKRLTDEGIPVMVLAAPMVPGLTGYDIFDLVKACADAGAYNVAALVVRLNGDIASIFSDWVRKAYPDRADKILNQIAELHGGQLNDSRFGQRMRGEGPYADMIHQQFTLAKKKFLKDKPQFEYNLDRYEQLKNPQLGLFD
jgi:DNA repair photolyase